MDWIPAVTTSSLLALVLWFGRSVISTRLTNAVKHDYDQKLANIQSELSRQEEAFREELRSKGRQIEALRAAVISNVSRRQDLIFDKQLQAIDSLWGAVISMAKAKGVATMLATFKFENAAQEAARNPEFRKMFEMMGQGLEISSFKTDDAQKARPYISLLAWAYYSAYQAIVFHALAKLQMLKSGLKDADIIDIKAVTKVVKLALPHQGEYIEKWGPAAFHLLLDELETKMLIAFQMMQEGKELDQEALRTAKAIIAESEKAIEESTDAQKA